MANIHSAQALYMTDENVFTSDLGPAGLGLEISTATTSNANYKYGSAAVAGGSSPAAGDGLALVDNNGAPQGTAAAGQKGVEYLVVATAHRKLAGCAPASVLDTWCLDNTKLITNIQANSQNSTFSNNADKCKAATRTVDGGAGC